MVWILTILTQGLMASKTRIGTLIFSNIIQFYVSWKARSPMAFLIYSKKRLGFCWASQGPATCWPGQWCNFRGETFKFPVLGHKLGLIQFLLKFIDFGSHGAGSRQQSQLKAPGPGLWLNIPLSQFLIHATPGSAWGIGAFGERSGGIMPLVFHEYLNSGQHGQNPRGKQNLEEKSKNLSKQWSKQRYAYRLGISQRSCLQLSLPQLGRMAWSLPTSESCGNFYSIFYYILLQY